MKRIRLSLFAVALLAAMPAAARAQQQFIFRISSSRFANPPAGSNSNVLLLSPDETLLFVTNQASNSITVFKVGDDADGRVRSFTFSSRADAPGGTGPVGMAVDPGGNWLYVLHGGGTILVYAIDPSGFLTLLQAAPIGTASTQIENSILYVSEPGGDFVYVDNDVIPNTVSIFAVNPVDGTLTARGFVPTGGNGGSQRGFFAAPMIQSDGNFLYVVNGNARSLGSNNISVLSIDPNTGALLPVTGSPFPIPTGSATSGSLALSPDGSNLFAGTKQGAIVKYDVDPSSGALSLEEVASSGLGTTVDGLAFDPDGGVLAATFPDSNQMAAIEIGPPMHPAPGSPFQGSNAGAAISGAIFSHLAPFFQQLLGGGSTAGAFTEVTIYDFGVFLF